MKLTRRDFVKAVPVVATSTFVSTAFGKPAEDPPTYAGFPSQDPTKVRDTVGASHANLARVKELVGASPALARATWDWGFGDWETALGAASHVGNREIAEYLVANGARPDIFYHTMMGHLDVVKAAVAAQPGIQTIHGPHGITLLAHARAGGDEAKAVHDYLLSLGDADRRNESRAITDEEKEIFIGDYAFGQGKDDILTIEKNRQGALWIKRKSEQFGRILSRIDDSAFSPAGAPKVAIRFSVENGKASVLTVHDPGPILVAKRLS